MTAAPLDRNHRTRVLERDALLAVTRVQATDPFGVAPNWMLPASIPTQRLSGLKRRGLLDSRHGKWRITKAGYRRLDELRIDLRGTA